MAAGGYGRGMAFSRARTALIALLIAGCAGLAACGGDDETAAKDEGPTRPQYVAQVDAICKKVTKASQPTNRKIQALVDGTGSFSSRLKKSTPLLQKTYDLQKGKLDDIEAIEQPSKDKAQIAEVVAVSSKALEEFKGGIAIARRGDLKEFIDIAFDANGTRAKAERLGMTYGFAQDCFKIPIELDQVS